MASRPPTALAGSPSVPASAGGSPTVIASTRPWIWPSLADQPDGPDGQLLGLQLAAGQVLGAGEPGQVLGAGADDRRELVGLGAQVGGEAAHVVAGPALLDPVVGRDQGAEQGDHGQRDREGGRPVPGRRRSTLWIRGPVAGRRTGRPWLRLLLPLMATLATPLPPSPLRPSGRDLTKRTATLPASALVLPESDAPAARLARAGEPAAKRPPIVVVRLRRAAAGLAARHPGRRRRRPPTRTSPGWPGGRPGTATPPAMTQWTRDAFPAMLTGR